MPFNDRFWLDDDEGRTPADPKPGQLCPEESISGVQLRPLHRVPPGAELVARSKDLQVEGPPESEPTLDRAAPRGYSEFVFCIDMPQRTRRAGLDQPADATAGDRLLLVARLYYIDGLSQADVATLAGVSQSKISRMLALARERGIVQISVPEYNPRNTDLERRLYSELRLDEAFVVRAHAGQPTADLRQAVGYFAAPAVARMFKARSTVAVGGGRSIQALVDRMARVDGVSGIIFVQAMGNIDSSPGPYDAIELCGVLARRWGGVFHTLSTPALLPDAATCRRMLRLEQVRAVLDRTSNADLAIVGIGTPEHSVFIERKVLGPADLDRVRKAGAVGEILGRFYDKAGDEVRTPFRQRVVSIGFEELRRVKRVLAVVAGGNRAAAIRAAVRGGLVKSLVIDDEGAKALLGGKQ